MCITLSLITTPQMKALFTSIKKVIKGGLLQAGQHITKVASLVEVQAEQALNWVDRTTQIKAEFKNEEGVICRWFNTAGYKSIADFPTGIAPKGFEFRSSENGNENYLVSIKTNERVISDEKTETAYKMIGEFIEDCGIPAGTEFADFNAFASAVTGSEVGVCVKDDGGKVSVAYTMHAERVKSAVEADL